MLVAEILKGKGDAVFTLAPDASLNDACAELERRQVGALIVCQDAGVVGVLSERDIVRAISRDGPEALMARMTDRRIRHLPVLLDKRLAGVVSIGDVVKCQIAQATQEAESLRTYIAAG